MQKLAIALVAVGLIVGGVFFSGLLDSDTAVTPTGGNTRGEQETTERPDLDFGSGAQPEADPERTEKADPDATETPASTTSELAGGTGIITGTVVDAAGAPLPGAVVHLRHEGGGNRWGNTPPPSLDDPARRLESDAEGRFHYDGLPDDARFTLFVRGAEWVGQTRRMILPDGQPHTITLTAGDVVSGVVLDPNGRPVEGAEVASALPMQKFGEGMYFPAMRGHDPNILHPRGLTDEDGSFRLSGIPIGEFSLEASHPDWAPSAPMNLMQGQSAVSIELRAGTGVRGVVVDGSGTPVGGAVVSARPFAFFGGEEENLASTTTDRNGRFQLEGLPPAQLGIHVTADGYPETARQLALSDEWVEDYEIVLERGASITGVVVDAEGVAVSGATVTFRAERMFGMPQDDAVRTDPEGRFTIANVRPRSPQPRVVTIDHPRYVVWKGEPLTVTASETIDLGTVVLQEALTVSGRVTDLEGAPVRGARIELIPDEPVSRGDREIFVTSVGGGEDDVVVFPDGARQRTSTDDDGTYSVRVDAPGTHTIQARAERFRKTASDAFVVADTSVTGIDLSLPPALAISGRVVDELGEPCAQVRVSSGGRFGGVEGAQSDESGSFTLDGLDDTTYDLTIVDEGWQIIEETGLGIRAGAEGVTLVARRPGQIVGRLTDASTGLPIAAFSITSQPIRAEGDIDHFSFAGFGFGAVEYRDPDGRFILDRAPGRHRVRFRAEDFVEETVEVEVSSMRESAISVELTPAGIIHGRVVDSDGAPITGAHVSAVRVREDGTTETTTPQREFAAISIGLVDGGGHAPMVFTTDGGLAGAGGSKSDEDGTFTLRGLSEGDYELRIRSSQFKAREVSGFSAAPGEVTETGEITLERGAEVSGIARAPVGKNLMWCTIRFQPESGERKSVTAQQDGTYSIGGLDAGTYTVKAEYMLEPEGEHGMRVGGPIDLPLGTIELATDETRTLHFDIPAE